VKTLLALVKTTAARLSALYLLLFAVCAVLLVFYMTGLSARMLADQTMQTINEEVADLAVAYQRGSVPLLVRMIDRRSRQPGANLYLIADPNGRILTGNVQALEPGVLESEGWTAQPFAYQRYGETLSRSGAEPAADVEALPHRAIALVLRLPNQLIMLVGRDLGEPERFRDVVRRALMVAIGLMGLSALLIWFFVGRRALRRIDNVSQASQRIMSGDLSGRLPVNGGGDEFDRLSENFNTMLSRIADLNEGLKQVSDNIALAGARESGEYREALEATIAESDQLIRTFNAILMISRLEAGYSSESTAGINLADAVRDVVELYEPVAEEAGVSLKAERDGIFSVSGNRELIGQALSNIVDNAIKYSAGTVTKPEVAVRLARNGEEIRLTVDDNGPGIPEEADRQRATERFVRLEQSRSQPGSGLGLSLAKAIMKFHGGRLELDTRSPGLSVTMVFPAEKGAA
jgi:signal transduction histidine kinase